MDTLSHYLWAVAMYWFLKQKRKWWLGLSGALPDLLTFVPLSISFLILGVDHHAGPPPLEIIPDWTFMLYNITHSLVVVALVFGILWYAWRPGIVITWGWALHILFDIPTHGRELFPTPFLWPISSWTFDGFMWGQWWFILGNYTALALVFGYLYWRHKRDSTSS